MPKHTGSTSKGKKDERRPRWHWDPDCWHSLEERDAAAVAFLTGAGQLIGGDKPPREWTEAQKLGMRLAVELQMAFTGVPGAEYVETMRRALEAFASEPGVRRLRARAVEAVAYWGTKWNEPKWQATPDIRKRLLEQIVGDLAACDEALAPLGDDLDGLAKKLDTFEVDPSDEKGTKSAERILAELIVEDHDALELGPQDDESEEDAVERICATLVADVDAVFSHRSAGG